MKRTRQIVILGAVALLVGSLVLVAAASGRDHASLSAEEIQKNLDQAEMAAKKEESLVRVDAGGKKLPTRMHIVVVDRGGRVVGQRSMADAWVGSISIARAKAYTALAFSSDENALTTRSLQPLTQPGGPLWNIGNSNVAEGGLIEFPGGMPLYKGDKLIGAVGVSGDGVEEDENVAEAGTKGFDAPKAIRVDTVTNNGVPYTK